jgi:recombination protein RecA
MGKSTQDFFKLMEDEYADFLVKYEEDDEVDVIPTGSLALDVSLGVGGIPKARFSTIWGPESSGKTSLSLSIAKQVFLAKGKTLYIDVENCLDYAYASALVGDISPDNLTIMQPETAEQSFEIAEAGIKSGIFDLIIFDSVGALAPTKVKEGEFNDSHVALVARMVGQFIARNAYQLRKNNVAFLFVNQVRAKIGRYAFGGFERPGGFALKHETSVEIFLTKAEDIKIDNEVQGILTKFTIKKNKLAPPFRTNYIPLTFGRGIDQGRDILSFAELLGVITKKGSFYSFEGETIGQGVAKASKVLDESPELLDKIKEMCYNVVKNTDKIEEEEVEVV